MNANLLLFPGVKNLSESESVAFGKKLGFSV